jgi:ketosteroid isomerase-like protein
MRKTLILGGLLLAGASTLAVALDKVSTAEVAQFRGLEDKLWQAWNTRLNPADAAGFYSKNPNNLYFDFAPLKFTGWEEYQRVASKTLAGGGHATTHIHDDFTVIKRGDLVVTAFTFDVEFARDNATPQTMTARETDVWTKESGKWVIVHQHMSTVVMMAPPAGAAKTNK